MLALAVLYALAALASRAGVRLAWLEAFGRHSLFVYWIHVELVYGYATWIFHHRLPLWGTFAAYAAFSVAMYWAVRLEERVLARRGGRPPVGVSAPEAAPA